MTKILAFAGSNSSTSINHDLVSLVASKLVDSEVTLIKLTDYPLPIFGEDLEKDAGYPEELERLLKVIEEHQALIISVNEHNGTVSAFFKNVLDWLSRIEYKFLLGKKVLLFSASPGKRGGQSSLEYTRGVLPRFNAEIIAECSFPSFSENFSVEEQKITNDALRQKVEEATALFLNEL